MTCDPGFVGVDSWVEAAAPHLQGADVVAIKAGIASSIREFCTKSGACYVFLKNINIQAGKETYALDYEQGYKILYLLAATVSGYPVDIVQNRPVGVTSNTSRPHKAWVPEPGFISLSPMPNVDIEDGLNVTVAVLPTTACSQYPDVLQDFWFDTILDGVLGRMQIGKGKPYSDKQAAVYYLKRFRKGMSEARDIVKRRFSTAESEWFYPQGWRVSFRRRGSWK